MEFKVINECKVDRWEIYLPSDPQDFFAGNVDDDKDDDDCNDDLITFVMMMIPCNAAQTILRGYMKNLR